MLRMGSVPPSLSRNQLQERPGSSNRARTPAYPGSSLDPLVRRASSPRLPVEIMQSAVSRLYPSVYLADVLATIPLLPPVASGYWISDSKSRDSASEKTIQVSLPRTGHAPQTGPESHRTQASEGHLRGDEGRPTLHRVADDPAKRSKAPLPGPWKAHAITERVFYSPFLTKP